MSILLEFMLGVLQKQFFCLITVYFDFDFDFGFSYYCKLHIWEKWVVPH